MSRLKSHLTLDERSVIETSLNARLSFKHIARDLGRDPSTISKEVRAHVFTKKNPDTFNPCRLRSKCPHNRDLCKPCGKVRTNRCNRCKGCYNRCPDFTELVCERLQKPPYVCNGCTARIPCRLERHLYIASEAQKEYAQTLSESRQGVATSREELERLDGIISPLIKKGQSIHHICENNKDTIMLDERTIYNYVEAGVLSVRNIDLVRKVRYRSRRKKKPVRVDRKCHEGRTYADYLSFIKAHPDTNTVEMDSVEGRKGGKVLLTIYFANCEIMLAFIRDRNDARSVTRIFEEMDTLLGRDVFQQLFPILLTDRGSEFTDPTSIERDKQGENRTNVFYCDPKRSDQKGGCEVTHEMIRRVIPKGQSMDHLTQKDIDLMMSHINSYARKKLGNKHPYEVFSSFYGEGILRSLGLQLVQPDDINLTPSLLKK